MNRKVVSLVKNIEEYVTFFLFSVMCLFVFLQIFSRYLLKTQLGFPEEVARHAYVWITFIGLSLAVKDGTHIKVDLIYHLLNKRWAKRLELIVEVGMLIFLLVMLVFGWQYTLFTKVNRWTCFPQFSILTVNISFPLGCLLAALRTIGLIYKNKKGLE